MCTFGCMCGDMFVPLVVCVVVRMFVCVVVCMFVCVVVCMVVCVCSFLFIDF